MLKANSVRHMIYEQQGGYLLVPLMIMTILNGLALTLPFLERDFSSLDRLGAQLNWFAPTDPNMAQIFLGAIAGSCITVVSILYSVLLVALTFASMQFSPRILRSFVKDRVSQTTLGLFIGTFSYCLVLLPSVQTGQHQYVPRLAMIIALLLAGTCLFFLIYFIHHMAVSIQVNYIIDRVARETEATVRAVFGPALKGFPAMEDPLIAPDNGVLILSTKSGYLQFIDEAKLLKLAKQHDLTIFFHRVVGQFIPAGVQCLTISPSHRLSQEITDDCISCLYIGPVRSMENDIEFGILQLVDIALKAISPAVNDPSTAIACIDQLSAVLLLAATLRPPNQKVVDSDGVVRILRRQPTFTRLLAIAYDQIIPYSKTDMAVSLRLMRALHDISGVTNHAPYLAYIRTQAQRIIEGCIKNFSEDETLELRERLTVIDTRQRSRA